MTLGRNATWSGFSAGVRAISGLMIALLAIRLLGGELYGQVVTLLSLYILYLSLNSSVFTILVAKLTGDAFKDSKLDDSEAIPAAIFLACTSILILTFFTALIWAFVPPILVQIQASEILIIDLQRAALVMGFLTALQIMVALLSAFVEGVGRLDLAMKSQLIGPLFSTFIFFVLLLFNWPVSALTYVLVLCFGAMIDIMILWLVLRKQLPSILSINFSILNKSHLWNLLKSGSILQAASLMNLFLEPLNKFLLNYFAGAIVVTSYDLAMKLIWGIQSLFAAAMRVFLHLSAEKGGVVGQKYHHVVSLILVPVLAVHTVAAVFLSVVVHYWIDVGDVFQIMLFFAIATVSNLGMIYITPLYTSLIGREDLYFILRSQSIVAATNLFFSLLLIPMIGLIGAVFGLMFATIYNVIAIFMRHEKIVGEGVSLKELLRGHMVRFVITAFLFLFAIFASMQASANLYLAALILLITGLLLKDEPLFGKLISRLRGI